MRSLTVSILAIDRAGISQSSTIII